jgi:hypothetical protein
MASDVAQSTYRVFEAFFEVQTTICGQEFIFFNIICYLRSKSIDMSKLADYNLGRTIIIRAKDYIRQKVLV